MGKKTTCTQEKFEDTADSIDIFGVATPNLNFRKKEAVTSVTGMFMTILAFFVFLLYAAIKVMVLIKKSNPAISMVEVPNGINAEYVVNFAEQGFKMAWAAESYKSGEDILRDPSMLMWGVQLVNIVGGKKNRFDVPLGFHKCTDKDFEEFYEPNIDAVGEFNRLKDGGRLYCLDDDALQKAKAEVFGQFDTQDHQRFEINLYPCNSEMQLPTDFEGSRPICNNDQEALFDYMQSSNLKMLFNSNRFDAKSYDKGKIVKESRIFNQQFDQRKTQFIHSEVKTHVLADETQWIQIGFSDNTNYFSYSIGRPQVSSLDDWQTRKYKIIGVELMVNFTTQEVGRQSYDILAFLGDLGGFFEALCYIGMAIATPFAKYKLETLILKTMFPKATTYNKMVKFVQSEEDKGAQFKRAETNLKHNNMRRKFTKKGSLANLICKRLVRIFGCDPERKQHKRIVEKSLTKVEKELDVHKMIYRMRVSMYSVMGLLTWQQQSFCQQLAALKRSRGLESGPTSSDDELLQNDNPPMYFMENISASQDPSDKRFMQALRILNRTDLEHAAKKGQLQATMDQDDININGIPPPDEDSAFTQNGAQTPKGGSPDGSPEGSTKVKVKARNSRGDRARTKIELIKEWPEEEQNTSIAKEPAVKKRGEVELSLLRSLNELQKVADQKSPGRDKPEELSKDKDGGNEDRLDVQPDSD